MSSHRPSFRASARALAALLLLLSAANTRAQQAPPALEELLRTQTDALGRHCEPLELAARGELTYVACGAAGLWTLRAHGDQATLLATQDLGGRVTGFMSADGRSWVKISSERAQPLEPLTTAPQPAAAQPAAATARPQPAAATAARAPLAAATAAVRGRVLRGEDELVLVAFTPGVQLPSGTHLAFTSAAPDGGGLREERVSVVGKVVSSAPGRARVELGTNERVPEAAAVGPTSAPITASGIAPPRAAGLWELGFMARPFLVLEDLGFGALLDAQGGYRMRAPFHFQAALSPFGFATARAGATLPFAALLSAAYDAHLFEVGLGLGAQSVNDPDFGLNRGSGTAIAQLLRLGARDGLHLDVQSLVTLFHSNFQFSSLRVRAQLPLGARTWLQAAGGGGTLGSAFGELGLRVLGWGNGHAGSLFVSMSVGWAAMFRGCNALATGSGCRELDYQGPLLGVGAELRR